MCLHVYLITFQTYTGLKRQFHLHVRMTPLTFPECSVQCQSLSPCVMPCHAAPVSGAFGGNILVRRCLVYAADMGLCLAQPSRTRQKLPRPRERESGVCVPELRAQLSGAASQHTPSCRQLSQGENNWQSPDDWPRGGLAKAELSWDYGAKSDLRSDNLRGIVSGALVSTSTHPQSRDQTGGEWSTDGRTNSDTS